MRSLQENPRDVISIRGRDEWGYQFMTKIVAQNGPESPFEKIKHVDEQGEYWLAREMQVLMGYTEWRKFKDAIERAEISCKNASHATSDHFVRAAKMVKLGSGSKRKVEDYRFSRYACYLVAMNSDPHKEEVSGAQTYFAVQTYYAENVQAGVVPSNKPLINSLWVDRMTLFNRYTKIPTNMFCIFEEISMPFFKIEQRGYELPGKAVPDSSVGRRWCDYAREVLHLDMSLVKEYPHHYPDHRGTINANIYPIAWQGLFTVWFRTIYIPIHLPVYLKGLKASKEEIKEILKGFDVNPQIEGN